MPVQVASLYGTLTIDDSDYKRKLGDARSGLKDLGSRISDIGGKMQGIGTRITAATAPIALGMGVAINQSRNFDRSMSNIFAITKQTGEEASTLRGELLNIGAGTVAGPQKIADAYYDIVSGVADASTHMAILNSAVATSEAGQADLKATTSALISTMNSYGFAADDAQYVSDVFSQTVAKGVLTMDELASAMPQVTGLASQFNVGIDEVGASMAYMTAQGFSASQSATFLKSMMTTLLNPTAELEKTITGLGYESGQAMLEAEGLSGAYSILANATDGLAGLITNQEALTGGLLVTKDAANEFSEDFINGIEGATEAAGAIQDETEGWDKLQSQLETLAIIVGDALMPVLTDLVENHVIPAVEAAREWIDENPELTKTILGIMGAAVLAGPVIFGLGTIFKGVALAIDIARVAAIAIKLPFTILMGIATPLGGVIRGAAGAFGALPAKMMLTLGPIFAIAAAVGAVIAKVHEFNMLVQEAAQRTSENIAPKLASGEITQQQLDDVAFAAVAENFGGGVIGDIVARATYKNFSNAAATGEFHYIDGRASGGPVDAGMPYLVGEQGPELFVPGTSGSIMNNGDTQAMGGLHIGTLVINARDGASGRQLGEDFTDFLETKLAGRGIKLSMGV